MYQGFEEEVVELLQLEDPKLLVRLSFTVRIGELQAVACVVADREGLLSQSATVQANQAEIYSGMWSYPIKSDIVPISLTILVWLMFV